MEIIDKIDIILNEGDTTSIVIADKITDGMWGGIWTDPNGPEAQLKLKDVIKATGNKNYVIMTFADADKLEKKNKKKILKK